MLPLSLVSLRSSESNFCVNVRGMDMTGVLCRNDNWLRSLFFIESINDPVVLLEQLIDFL